ncbi:MAG: porin [Rhodospirillum sp.]|nr:porin [Rhodospirillum sp.]MCF8490716.1 porin [Rhodospirillum sp.]MCF8499385.1 porin [Rhodospirillum sp.]
MKKVLFGTTTLVAAGLISGTAFAGNVTSKDNLELSIGGKMEQYFGGVGTFKDGGREDGFGINTDTELYFTGKTTLDNGITVKAVIQLEAQTSNTTNADEQYVELSGSFGKIQAGQKEDAATQVAVVAPTVGAVGVNDTYVWLGAPNNGSFLGGDTTWGSDDASVAYFTPSFFGFTGAVSYTPTPGSALVPAGTSGRDQIDFGVGFSNEFGGVGIDADAGAHFVTSDDAYMIRSGLKLSYAGFAVGGSMRTIQGNDNAGDGTWQWDAGVTYGVGPYAVGFTHGGVLGAGTLGDQQSYKLGGSYAMGPGVSLVGNVFYANEDANSAAANDSRDGIGAVAGVVLSF